MLDDVFDQIENDLYAIANVRRELGCFNTIDQSKNHAMLTINLGMAGCRPLVPGHFKKLPPSFQLATPFS